MAQYNADGDLVRAKRAGGTSGEVGYNEVSYNIAVDGSGNSYVTGYFGGSATFGPGEAGETTLTSLGSSDIFMAKYFEEMAPPVTVTWCDPSSSAPPGSQVTVYVCVDDVTDKGIISYQFEVTYDNSVLSCVGAASTGAVTEPFGPPTVNCSTPGQITVGGFGVSPLAGSGTFVCLIFDVVGAPGTTTDLCLQDVLFNAGDPVASVPVPCCPFEVENNHDISGRVTYCPTVNPVPNTTLTLSGGASDNRLTDSSGDYLFEDLPDGLNYSVTPSKSDGFDPLTITCFDAAQTAQHAVSLITLPPCGVKAADVDENGLVQTFDAALTCRFAVGLPPFGPEDHTGEWRFEPASRSYTPLNSDQTNQDYVATLLGDVDGNWIPATLAKEDAPAEVYVHLTDLIARTGEQVSIPLIVDPGEGALSADIDFAYDPRVLQFVEVSRTDLSEEFKVVTNATEGLLRVGAYGTEAAQEGGALLLLRFEVIGEEETSSPLLLERYQLNGGLAKHAAAELVVGTQTPEIPEHFALGQNYPNPFNPETVIEYQLAGAGQLTLDIYNLLGEKVVTLRDGHSEAGYHQVRWNGRDNKGQQVASGVYVYRLEVQANGGQHFVATRKMNLLR